MQKELFGRLASGEEIFIYTLKNESATLSLLNFGATVHSFVPFGVSVIGGFDSLSDYLADTSHQGGTVGRVSNRIENAEFTMDGAIYMLTANDGDNCLHGGLGFDRRVWNVEECDDKSITFTYYSPDGEEGFPSGLLVKLKYTLSGAAIIISYEAYPEGKTPIALTNHSYFNLDGFGGLIHEQVARIYADRYTEVNESLIPTGNRPSVRNTVFDFTEPKKIGADLSDFDGYDHNFLLSPEIFREFLGTRVGLAAVVESKKLRLSVYTDQPCAQFYIGNFLGDGPTFSGGIPQVRQGAFCLETQTEPNSIKRGEGFYDAGEVYRHTCVYEVSRK